MQQFLSDILIDPETGAALTFDKEKKILYSKESKHIYSITDKVPVLLKKPADELTSEPHTLLHTNFNYTDHYQKDAEVYDYFSTNEIAATKQEIKRLHQEIIKRVPAGAELLLDAGCGNGWLAHHFLKKNKKVISMDISTINPARALQNNPNENHAAIVADAYHLPLKNNSIDCIVASEIMEHVHSPKLFVQSLLEKLAPGGRLIITTPYNEKIEYFLCVHCNQPTPRNAHLHSFNKKNISDIFNDLNVSWSAKTFANKYLIKTRLNVLLAFLPYSLWKFIDASANLLFHSPTRFIIEVSKK